MDQGDKRYSEALKKMKPGEVVWISGLHGFKMSDDGETLKIIEKFPGYNPLEDGPLFGAKQDE